jgi:hypothetical protein
MMDMGESIGSALSLTPFLFEAYAKEAELQTGEL